MSGDITTHNRQFLDRSALSETYIIGGPEQDWVRDSGKKSEKHNNSLQMNWSGSGSYSYSNGTPVPGESKHYLEFSGTVTDHASHIETKQYNEKSWTYESGTWNTDAPNPNPDPITITDDDNGTTEVVTPDPTGVKIESTDQLILSTYTATGTFVRTFNKSGGHKAYIDGDFSESGEENITYQETKSWDATQSDWSQTEDSLFHEYVNNHRSDSSSGQGTYADGYITGDYTYLITGSELILLCFERFGTVL